MHNVVIVGLGPSAVPAVQALLPQLPSTHSIVAISSTDGYWPIAGLRAAVVPGWEDKVVAPLTNIFPCDSRHVLIRGTTVTELNEHSVVLDKPHPEFGNEVEFDYAILATGSSYPFPARPHPNTTLTETKASLQALQSSLSSAKSVLVVGGGPVGIEYAAEVASHYNGKEGRARKEVTVVHSHDKFMYEDGWKDKFNNSLLKQVKDLGVEVVLGQRVNGLEGLETGPIEGGTREFKLSNGEVVRADYIMIGTGNNPNTSFIRTLDPSLLNSRKQVLVKPTFQLAPPGSSTEGKGKYDHIFAIGDITDVPETKMVAHASKHGPIAAANLLALLASSSPGSKPSSSLPLKNYGAAGQLMMISLGPSGGAGQVFGWTLGAWMTGMAKSRTLFLSNFKALYGV
ncbi:hypothetical protein JCM11251_007555 [Rhodosporidiobolus azoricus]